MKTVWLVAIGSLSVMLALSLLTIVLTGPPPVESGTPAPAAGSIPVGDPANGSVPVGDPPTSTPSAPSTPPTATTPLTPSTSSPSLSGEAQSLVTSAIQAKMGTLRSHSEAQAVQRLRLIAAAEATYQSTMEQYGSLDQLLEMKLIDPALGIATTPERARSGYCFGVTVETGSPAYFATANPAPSNPGDSSTPSDHCLYIDEAGIIYQGRTPALAHAPPGALPAGFERLGN